MVWRDRKNKSGFSLTEMAIVLGVAGCIFGALWTYAASGRQAARIEQSSETMFALTDAVRTAYNMQISINGGVQTVLPYLEQMKAVAPQLIRSTTSSCGGVTSYYADTPWQSAANPCGNLQLCAWDMLAARTNCTTPSTAVNAQFFAIEFQNLTYANCVALVLSQNNIAGFKDVLINGNSAVSVGGGLPLNPAFAQNTSPVGSGCQSASVNTIDFVYTLHAPST